MDFSIEDPDPELINTLDNSEDEETIHESPSMRVPSSSPTSPDLAPTPSAEAASTDDSAPAGTPHESSAAAAGGDPAAARTIRLGPNLLHPATRRAYFSGLFLSVNIFLVLMVFAVVLMQSVALFFDWGAWGGRCDGTLRAWTVVCILFLVTVGANNVVQMYLNMRRFSREPNARVFRWLARLFMLDRYLALLWYGWTLMGVFVLLVNGSPRCRANDAVPLLFYSVVISLTMFLAALVIGAFFSVYSLWSIVFHTFVTPFLLFLMQGGTAQLFNSGRGAAQSDIDALRHVAFGPELEIDEAHSACAICLSDYEMGEALRYLPCKHHFHADCIDQWLLSNKSCPFCKRDIDCVDV